MARNVQQDRIQLRIEVNGKQVENTIKDLQKSYRDLNRDRQRALIGSEEHKTLTKEAERVKALLDEQRLSSRGVANGLKDGAKSAGIFGQSVQAISGVLKSAFAPLLALEAFSGIASITTDLFDAAAELEAFEQKSETVFGNALENVKQFAAQNAADMGLTRKEYIATATAAGDLLIPMGFQREEAAQLSGDLINLSGALSEWSGGQQDAKEVSDILTKALLGEREQLKGLGISISEADVQQRLLEKGQKSLTGTALQQAKAMATLELITEKSSDAQAAYAQNSGSLLRQQARLSAMWKDLRERLVQGLIPAFASTLGFITKLTGGSVKYSDQMEKERVELNVLVGRITSYNEKSDERKKLIDQLRKQHPGFLQDLNAESVSNAQLRDRLKEVNQEMINKILLQQKDEEILEKQQKSTAFLNDALEKQDNLRKELQKAIDKGVIEAPQFEGGSLNDEIENLIEFALESEKKLDEASKNRTTFFNEYAGLIVKIGNARRDLNNSYQKSNIEFSKATDLLDKRNELAQKLGLSLDELNKKEEEVTTTTSRRSITEEDIKREEEAAKARADAQRKIEELRIEIMQEGLEKRIAQISFSAQEEINALKGTDEQIKQQTELILTKKQQDIETVEKEFAEKRRQEFAANNQKEEAETKESQQRQLTQLDQYHEQRIREITDQALQEAEAGTLTPENVEAEIQARMLKELQDYLQKRKELLQSFGLDTTAIEQQIADLNLDIFRGKAQEHIDIEEGKWNEITRIAENASQVINGFLQLQATQARGRYDEEIESLEKSKRKELSIYEGNEEKRKEIEEEFDRRRNALDLKFKQEEKQRAVKQSIIDTAIAAVRALSTPPAPNIGAAVLAGALGAIQTATIVSQKFAKGGLTVDKKTTQAKTSQTKTIQNPFQILPPIGTFQIGGMVPKPFLAMAGEAGPEWIGPNWMLRHPTYGPVIQNLETARLRGFEEGGLTSNAVLPQPSDEAVQQAGESAFTMLIDRMDQLIAISSNPKLFGVITEKTAMDLAEIQSDVNARRVETGFGA